MKGFFVWASLLGATTFLTGCNRNSESNPDPAPLPEREEVISGEPDPAAQNATLSQPALTEAAIESLIADALSPTGEDAVASADPEKFSIHNLPEEQRKTLNEALQKAVSKIDFKALLSSMVSNFEIKGLDLANLPANANVTTRVLTPEEAKKMGINLQAITEAAGTEEGSEAVPGNVSIGDVQIITVGTLEQSGLPSPNPEDPGDDETPKTGVTAEMNITQMAPIEVTEESDPERAARFQSLLESGNSDALAGEIANLIQTGIDSATLRQAMGGEIQSVPPAAP